MRQGRDLKWLLWFGVISVLLRLPSMFTSVIDHDESTYILIAHQLLDGGMPYVVNLDVKPVGIYLLFAIVLKVFHSIFAIRIFAALTVALSGYLLFRIHETIFQNRSLALASGVLFMVCGSLHKWSWSGNTEIFFVCCSLGCLLILLLARHWSDFIWFGLLAGVGFLIKFHIAFDLLALVVFYYFWSGEELGAWLRGMAIAFCSFLLVLSSVYFYYESIGHLDDLKFAMVTIPSNYASSFSVTKMLGFVAEFYLSFAPIFVLLVIGIRKAYLTHWMRRPEWILFGSWTILSWVGIVVTGKFFFHYYFQTLPVFCLFALTYFLLDEENLSSFRDSRYVRKLSWLWGILIVVGIWSNQWSQVVRKGDVINSIAEDLYDDWETGDKIYTNHKNILYFLLDAEPPTKYTHTTVLYDPELSESYRVDVERELQYIVDQQMDYYVIAGDLPQIISGDIATHFELSQHYPDDVKVFRRKKYQ